MSKSKDTTQTRTQLRGNPMYGQRVVPSKKGKGSYTRKPKHTKETQR